MRVVADLVCWLAATGREERRDTEVRVERESGRRGERAAGGEECWV